VAMVFVAVLHNYYTFGIYHVFHLFNVT
jgi:hypothetical protein